MSGSTMNSQGPRLVVEGMSSDRSSAVPTSSKFAQEFRCACGPSFQEVWNSKDKKWSGWEGLSRKTRWPNDRWIISPILILYILTNSYCDCLWLRFTLLYKSVTLFLGKFLSDLFSSDRTLESSPMALFFSVKYDHLPTGCGPKTVEVGL